MGRSIRAVAGAATASLAVVSLTACGGDDAATQSATGSPSDAPTAGGPVTTDVIELSSGAEAAPDLDPSRFTTDITNDFFPLRPGSRWVYRETSPDGEVSTITVEVLAEHRTVAGIDALVVHDVATDAEGAVLEDTYDWYAEDAQGSVWYLGEATTAYDDGAPSTDGSWEAGVGGASPGLAMPGSPSTDGGGYRQEFLPGVAEDRGRVIDLGVAVSVPAGSYDDTVRTRDWTPLEPTTIEEKTYARGIGLVHDITTAGDSAGEEAVLISFDPG